MAMIYRDSDANLGLLMDKRITVLGYGNMGRSFALNLRDSAFPVLIGNQPDAYAEQAYRDGFEVLSIADATARSNFILVMLPDEIGPQIYLDDIAPHLQSNDTLIFASGFNVAFGFIEPPAFVDVILVAPQATGSGVRENYVEGRGYMSFVAVGQDASGEGWSRVLSIAKALGALHRGAVEMTFQQEAELDLFTQQALLPAFHSALQTAIDVLSREGFPLEAITMSLYLSGELGYLVSKWAQLGIPASFQMHSQTGQYGTLSRIERFREVKLRRQMETVLDTIRRGDFAQEWAAEFSDGYPRLKSLQQRLEQMSIWQSEQEVLALRQEDSSTS